MEGAEPGVDLRLAAQRKRRICTGTGTGTGRERKLHILMEIFLMPGTKLLDLFCDFVLCCIIDLGVRFVYQNLKSSFGSTAFPSDLLHNRITYPLPHSLPPHPPYQMIPSPVPSLLLPTPKPVHIARRYVSR